MLVGSYLARFEVTLRVRGMDLDPDKVSSALRCKADRGHRKGDLISVRANAKAPTGLWLIKRVVDHAEGLDGTIASLLERATAERTSWDDLAQRFECDLLVGGWMDTDNAMWGLATETIQSLAERNLSLNFDIYAIFDD